MRPEREAGRHPVPAPCGGHAFAGAERPRGLHDRRAEQASEPGVRAVGIEGGPCGRHDQGRPVARKLRGLVAELQGPVAQAGLARGFRPCGGRDAANARHHARGARRGTLGVLAHCGGAPAPEGRHPVPLPTAANLGYALRFRFRRQEGGVLGARFRSASVGLRRPASARCGAAHGRCDGTAASPVARACVRFRRPGLLGAGRLRHGALEAAGWRGVAGRVDGQRCPRPRLPPRQAPRQ
mmetsp:Transcript_64805/g.187856  ORF Transcript_64805/g.187856 Transcript_64805/m.187856 type:complete len:239 (-) Transcript_64805:429-1145(-)